MGAGGIRVRPVASPADLMRFIKLPLRLYRGDPNFVPHLISERRRFFSQANPLFEFTEVHYLLARDEHGKVIGRLSAHINRRHNEFWNEKTGFFGFFECAERFEAARALMEAAEAWLRQRGMTAVRGPFNFSTNEECGFLAKGFDSPPVLMMPYTKPYYLEFMDRLGYRRVKDLFAYYYEYGGYIPEYLVRLSSRVQDRTGVTVRTIQKKNFEESVAKVMQIYNSAWARNWGFVPMTEAEFRYMAQELKPILDPAIALIAEKDGRPVAFSLSLPDYNVVLRKMRGRFLPLGWLHFLLGRRSIDRIRIIILGVIEQYRNQGIDILLYYDTFRNGLPRGYRSCEMSWVLEDNVRMIRPIERMGARHYKTYRIYEKAL